MAENAVSAESRASAGADGGPGAGGRCLRAAEKQEGTAELTPERVPKYQRGVCAGVLVRVGVSCELVEEVARVEAALRPDGALMVLGPRPTLPFPGFVPQFPSAAGPCPWSGLTSSWRAFSLHQFGGGAHGLVGATRASEMAAPVGRAEPSGCLSLLVLLH